jgi:hypothetical protein
VIRGSALLVIAVALLGWSGVFAAGPGQQGPADLRRLALTTADLPPGFIQVAGRTSYDERPDGVAVYETAFTRVRTPTIQEAGPVEVRNGIARTAGVEEAANQLAASRDAFLEAGWTDTPVPPLGEEAAGLSSTTDGPTGPETIHQYLFRQGPFVVIVGVGGRASATSPAQAVALAILISDRIHAALGTGPAGATPTAPGPAPTAPTGPPGGPVGPPERVWVTNVEGGSANVRAEPSTSAPILTQLPEGTVLELAGPNREAEGRLWRNVRLPDGRTGWIAASLLAPVAPSPMPRGVPSPGPLPTPTATPPAGPVEAPPQGPLPEAPVEPTIDPAPDPAPDPSPAPTDEPPAARLHSLARRSTL